MARPKKSRIICRVPDVTDFNAGGIPGRAVELSIDEYETIRLLDHVGLTQGECAKQLRVARSTVTATYDTARQKLAEALVRNRPLRVRGELNGFQLCPNADQCCGHCGRKNRCGKCRHGSCEQCVGIFHPPGEECFVMQFE